MNKSTFAVLAAFAAAALAGEPAKLGKPLTLKEPQAVRQVLAAPDALVGKTVQVKGKVTEVCQMMGCWMALADLENNKVLRVKVNDGDIVFPKESVGKVAVAEGTLAKLTLSREQAVAQARHEAEEQGRKFNPASIKSGTVIYQLNGSGAVIE
jgi:hypothetical protein